jgi:hypothetical protein
VNLIVGNLELWCQAIQQTTASSAIQAWPANKGSEHLPHLSRTPGRYWIGFRQLCRESADFFVNDLQLLGAGGFTDDPVSSHVDHAVALSIARLVLFLD